jgi:hypothetical protein
MKKLKIVFVLALGLALYCAATVGSASGARAANALRGGANPWDCDPQAPRDGGHYSGTISGRGTTREPDLGQVVVDLPASAKGKAGRNFRATVPVYFHVVTDGSIGSLTSAQISAQMDVLNNTYAGGEGGAKTGFSFTLAGVTRTDNADWFYAGPGGTDEHSMKAALHQGGTNALNFYSTTAGPYLGWAYLPDIVTKPGQAYLDGIVINWESIPGTSTTYAGRYDQGQTATHETGHWLDLEHTFYGGATQKVISSPIRLRRRLLHPGALRGKTRVPHRGSTRSTTTWTTPTTVATRSSLRGQAQRMRDAWLFYRA